MMLKKIADKLFKSDREDKLLQNVYQTLKVVSLKFTTLIKHKLKF
jgi:hypothetical protein